MRRISTFFGYRAVIFILLTLSPILLQAQDISNRGREFWLGYNLNFLFFTSDNGGGIPQNSQELVLYISAEQAATVTVSINGTSWSKTLNIPANSVDVSIKIPKAGASDNGIDARLLSDGLSTKGIHIVSDVPVAVFAHHYSAANSAATMLMPVESWGYKYHAITYTQLDPDGFSGIARAEAFSLFYITASEDNTKIEITPSDSTENGWLPNQPNVVSIDKGQIYVVYGKNNPTSNPNRVSKDMTGSKIISLPGADGKCHPIGVFSGSGINRLCPNNGGENIIQQVFPEQAWGTKYITYHTIGNKNGDFISTNRNYYRICLSDPTTVVKLNGLPLNGLIKNFYYEIVDSTGGDLIEADKPILVAQYLVSDCQCWKPVPSNGGILGDPEMIFISPVEQGQKSATFYTSYNQGVLYIYSNIFFPTTAAASLKIDGSPVDPSRIIPHPNYPSYSVAFLQHTGPPVQHTVTCDSNFTAYVYGLGPAESYGYNVGTRINNLNNYSAIKNTYNTSGNTDTFTCPKTPVRLFIKLGFQATTITWKLSQVPGLSVTTDSVVNNPVAINTESINGRTYYVYTLQQDFTFATAGTYTIPYSYSSLVIDNCSKTEFGTMQVVVKPGPVADFSVSNVGCLKDTVSFTSTISANGFNIINYLWNFDDATTQTTINAKKRFAVAGVQNVRYRIYADNGCAGDTTKTISINESPVVNLGNDISTCGSGPILLDATNTNSTYLWQDGSTNPTFSVTSSGLYWVQVTKTVGGCSARDSINITLGSFPGFNLGPDRAICQGDTLTLNATVAGAVSYLWSTGATTPTIKVFAAGTYWCEVNNGCVQRDSILITAVNPKPVVNFGADISTCAAPPILLDATNANATYLWQDGSTNPTFNANASGLYWAQVTNSTGCIARDSINIAFNSSPVFNLGADRSICQGDTITLNATVASAISYLWSTGATTPTIKVFAAGTYWCQVNNGCTFRDSLIITAVNPKPVVNLGADITTCSTPPILLDATNTNATYLWQDGSTNATFNANASGLYWAQVTNSTGCVARDSINIAFNSVPVFNLGADRSICQGDTVTLNAKVAGAISYLWNNGSVTPTLKVFAAGTYWCQVNNGCTFRDSLTITSVMPSPIASFSILKDTLCEGRPLSFSSTVTGVNAWHWNLGNGSSTTAPPFTRTYTTAGIYNISLTVTGSNGCISVPATDILNINPIPKVNAGANKIIQTGSNVLLDATVTPAAAYNYLWTPATDLSSSSILQPVASPLNTTTYVLSVEGVNSHCKASDDVQVMVVSKLFVPNAFTPNGDGINDKWEMPGLALYPNAVVTVFNRYGQKVIERSNYNSNPWDGTFLNQQQPAGAYVYLIVLNDANKQVMQGQVLIIH